VADGFDPYKTLQVDPEAEDEVIQAAYRRLARKYHPDVAPGADAATRMAAINAAWELIGEPAARAAFDRQRSSAAGAPPGRPSGTVLNFGRYAGWSLGEIARRDMEYIEWLDRAPIGRNYRQELDEILRASGRRRTAERDTGDQRGLYRRR